MARSSINEMLRIIESECRVTKGLTGREVLQHEVLEAMGQVPRDAFVPGTLKSFAYNNSPLPIGNGQTISQPFIVALMTDLLTPGKDDVILGVRHGDGYRGWPEHAPFDGIIVTAAIDHVPPPLKEQLKPGGRLIIPVGYPHMTQQLLLLEKDEAGKFTTRNVLPVAFVPLTGEARLIGLSKKDRPSSN